MKIYLEKKLRYNGLDVGPGEKEIDDATAQEWIKRGWARTLKKETVNKPDKTNTKNVLDELYEKAVSMNLSPEKKSKYKGEEGIEKLTALIQGAGNGSNTNTGKENGSENSGENGSSNAGGQDN